jgi:SET domain-containing protein
MEPAVAGGLVITNSCIHGLGGFARSKILKGEFVVEYVGERISKSESLRRCQQDNQFIFALDDQWDLDGNVPWNPARFLNHSCAPNCEAEFRDGRIWIVAIQDIRAGEEITFNYGYDLSDYKEHPCHCGSKRCVGFIVADVFFDTIRI